MGGKLWRAWWGSEMSTKFLLEKMNARNHSEGLDKDGSIILKEILNRF